MQNKCLSSLAILAAITVALASSLVSNPASAGPRYATPPPAVLSPDLTAPWLLQLRYPPAVNQTQNANSKYARKYQVQMARPAYQPHKPVAKRGFFQRTNSWMRSARTKKSNVVQAAVQTQRKAWRMEAKYEPQIVSYPTNEVPGTIIIETNARFLYLVMENGMARRYGVGVGRPGFEWSGINNITRKAPWPDWRPPAVMIARELRENGRVIPPFVKGGPDNPLGARALYLGSTIYRIHGTGDPKTIGRAVSSGCIRMRNEDVMDLYERVGVGTKVIVT